MKDNPNISVIVPVYNTEKYLKECIDSILTQTFTDFELLLIDDGSTDNSGTICDDYAAKDSRVRVFHKPNGGVSSARNLGLDNVRGKWVVFVDADDIIPYNSLKERYVAVSKDSVDLAIFQHESFGYENVKYGPYCPKIYYNLESFQLDYSSYIYYIRSLWNKIYRISVIALLRFDEQMSLGEDYVFNISYLLQCKCLKLQNSNIYQYRTYKEPSLSKCFTLNNLYNIDRYTVRALVFFRNELGKKAILSIYVNEINRAIFEYFANTSIPTDGEVQDIMLWYNNSLLKKLPIHKYNNSWKQNCLRLTLSCSLMRFAPLTLSLVKIMKCLFHL